MEKPLTKRAKLIQQCNNSKQLTYTEAMEKAKDESLDIYECPICHSWHERPANTKHKSTVYKLFNNGGTQPLYANARYLDGNQANK